MKQGETMLLFVQEIRDASVVEKTETFETEKILASKLDFVTFGPYLKVYARAQRVHNDAVVNGTASTSLKLTCARCLDEFERPLDVKFEQIYGLDAHEIDLTNDIRESVLVEVPYKAVCSDDCKGICTSCGNKKLKGLCTCDEKPAHSAWDALKQFPFRK